ncbi:MAG: DegV family protein [Clostridia bacterium]
MSDYIILTDSCSDLTEELMKELEIDGACLKFTIDGRTYVNTADESSMKNKDFYAMLRDGKSAITTQVNAQEFYDIFDKYLKQGKDILYIGFSSGLSGTFQSSVIAQKDIADKYPDRKIIVVDSLCASCGEGMLVYNAVMKKREGYTIENLATWVENNKLHLCHWFTVDDLHHLKRGGRVSAATAVVGTMLSIKPVLHVDDEGHLINVSKVRGRRQSLDTIVAKVGETAIDPKAQTMFISHGDCLEDAQYVAKQIKSKYGTKKIITTYVGPVVGGHAGPGTLALFFFGTKR